MTQEISTDTCSCLGRQRARTTRPVRFHAERQDTSAPGWRHLLALVEEAAADGREEFRPLAALTPGQRRQIVTLPPSIAKLTEVRHLNLYGSNLVRIPPEIGEMTSLRQFTPYTSYRLHWFPYELTRCANLRGSTVSTRALYGNVKYRPPFPLLPPPSAGDGELDPGQLDPGIRGGEAVRGCSVCRQPIGQAGLHQVWISLRVGADVLPLLVNACSAECVAALPTPARDHVGVPHTGGPDLRQPPADG
ncbi:leucine-rich repeat domain-containing protein [Plantactinospora solaniradicis]|uniref:Leucine-rich repeat domain-containing protein n=1 Tax=Plantactinospora solaniradicis TaxID=1723736 RepID=A0ABW1K7D9_9ACTN